MDTAARLARYWIEDQDVRVETLLERLGKGLAFESADAGWSVHTSSEMAVPPHIEQPPAFVRPSQLWQIGLLACIASRWPLAVVMALPCSTPMHAAMNLAVSEQLATPPSVAMCLENLLHPALSQEIQATTQKHVMRCGPDSFSRCLAAAMARPLAVGSHAAHAELLAAVRRGHITLKRHATVGMVTLPCSIRLVCSSTDHVLLFLLLLRDGASMVSGLADALAACAKPARSDFWHTADAVHIRAS